MILKPRMFHVIDTASIPGYFTNGEHNKLKRKILYWR